MSNKYLLLFFSILFCVSRYTYADAKLEKQLGLDTEMSKQVQLIQKKYREQFRPKRSEYNKESRKLRRARSDNNSEIIAQQELIVEQLSAELEQIRHNENEAIRQILTPEQNIQFEEILQQRREMAGSSRDIKSF